MDQNVMNFIENALAKDETLRASFEQTMSRLVAAGETDAAVVAEKAADTLGLLKKAKTAALEALPDDALDMVGGGRSYAANASGEGFSFNAWIGKTMRDLMKKDSAENAARGLF